MRAIGIIIAVCGFGWAAIGVINVFIMLAAVSEDKISSDAGAISLIVNVVLFGLPGLGIGALGMLVAKKK